MIVVEQADELGLTIVGDVFDYRVSFKIYKHISYDENNNPIFPKDENEYNSTTNYEQAESLITGSVKWDACSNWDFKTDDTLYHGCSRNDLTRIGEAMGMCWDITKEYCPNADEEMFDK